MVSVVTAANPPNNIYALVQCPVEGSKNDLNTDVKVNKKLTIELR
jgi:hypothetical protein